LPEQPVTPQQPVTPEQPVTPLRPLRVLLADAAPMQRSGLRMVLTTSHIGAASTATTTSTGNATSSATTDSRVHASSAPGGNPRAGALSPSGNDPRASASSTSGGGRRPATSSAARTDPVPGAASGSDVTASFVATDFVSGYGEQEPEIVVAGEAGDGVEAIDLARRLLPDVLITDLVLPRVDGLGVTRAVSEAGLPVRVLVLTDNDTDEDVLAAITAGASGFLRKDAPAAELTTAVRAVAAGGAVITPAVLARILARVADALPAPETTMSGKLDALTEREREVLVHVARGHSNAEIAVALRVSETTIKTHVGHVLTKLRLRDRTQAVVLAYETGLVKPGA
jgi:DNA-binding NarL/FixJ family response regulator